MNLPVKSAREICGPKKLLFCTSWRYLLTFFYGAEGYFFCEALPDDGFSDKISLALPLVAVLFLVWAARLIFFIWYCPRATPLIFSCNDTCDAPLE